MTTPIAGRGQGTPLSNSTVTTLTFETAKREYQDAWNNPLHTRFELPSVNVTKVLKDRYRVSADKRLSRSMMWVMETKKAWNPLTYIPYA